MEPASSSRKLIDTDVYLASLVSDVQTIDPLLDEVRRITSTLPASGELTEPQTTALSNVRQQLEQHLLTKEAVRVFTPQSLQAQIEYFLSGGKSHQAALRLWAVIGLAVIVVGLAARFIHISNPDLHIQIVGMTFVAMLHVGAVILFVTALSAFTEQLRKAFSWICMSVFVLGASLVAQSIFEIVGLKGLWRSFAEMVPALVTAFTLYVGARLYAKSFIAPSRANSVGTLIVISVVACVVSAFLPHAPIMTTVPEWGFRLVLALEALVIVLTMAGAVRLYQASRRMSELYLAPTRSIAFAAMLSSLVILYAYMHRLFSGGGASSKAAAVVIIGLVSLMGFTILYSGYVLNKASRY